MQEKAVLLGAQLLVIDSNGMQCCNLELRDYSASFPVLSSSNTSYHRVVFPRAISNWTHMTQITELPPEVLTLIFGHLAADRPDDPPDQHARTHSRTNFAFSHVCRYWRRAALAEPRLWTRIHALSPVHECILSRIERSRDLALVVVVPCPKGGPNADWRNGWDQRRISLPELSMEQLHRISTLDVTVRAWMRPALSVPIQHDSNVQAPLLKHLRVDCIDCRHSLFLPLGLLIGGAPLLESLDLCRTNQFWGWGSIRLQNLKHLSVHAGWSRWGGSARAVETHSMDQLVVALAHSPQLEELTLLNCIPLLRSPPTCIAQLPNLRRIRLNSVSERIRNLLVYLSLPPSASRDFHVTWSDIEDHSLSDDLAVLSGRIHSLDLHLDHRLARWTAFDLGSDTLAEWKIVYVEDVTESPPAVFSEAQELSLQWSGMGTLTTLFFISTALPTLGVLSVKGGRNCMKCIRAFGKLPADAFPQLREWDLLDLDKWWHPSVGNSQVEIMCGLIESALAARQALGHRLLVLCVPSQLLGPWSIRIVERQLVSKVETFVDL
jgi:hypothetical protein